MTAFPDGPGVDCSGVLTPDTRCGPLLREFGQMLRPAIEAGLLRVEKYPLVAAHFRQLSFGRDRLSAAASAKVQVGPDNGNTEFREPGDPSCSEDKPGLSTAEAGRILEMTPRSVLNLIYRGSLKGTRSARGWIVDMGSVAELYEQHREENERRKAA